MRGGPVTRILTVVLAVLFGPLVADGTAQTAAPSVAQATGGAASVSGTDWVGLAAVMAQQAGGVVDGGGGPAPRLGALIAERAAKGEHIWALLVREDADLAAGLRAVGGRVAPGPREMVLVASRNGVRARVPALAGSPARIDAAFEASRRELAADLDAGLCAFVRRVEEARDEEGRRVELVLWGLGGVALIGGLGTLARWGRFRKEQRGWERDAAAAHARRVGVCQEKLHALATAGDPAYDALYAELKELSGRAPDDAAGGLDELARKLDRGGAR